MTNLHPVFRGILAGLGMPEQADAPSDWPKATPNASDIQSAGAASTYTRAACLLEARKHQYIFDLMAMDWTFEESDDQRAWRRGRDELERLRRERAEIDPDGAIWRAHAHPDYRR